MNQLEDRPGDAHQTLERTPDEPSRSGEDPRLANALEEYLGALEAGRKPNRHEFLKRYPEIAGPLAECIDGLEFVNGAAPQVQLPLAGQSAGAPAATADVAAGMPLGDFRIVREIGRGGMGVVYEAEQLSLGRRVALKVLPFAAALDPKQLQRFKNEAQAAAHLNHPHIVPVHYVGCERGVHFYAMQYIDGHTLAAVIRELRRSAGPNQPGPAGGAGEASALVRELTSGRWAPVKQSPAIEPQMGPYSPAGEALTTTAPLAALSTERSTTSPGFFHTVASLGVQAAEALEHAHQLGVIHRDIKPANLLVEWRAGGVNPPTLWVTDFGLARLGGDAGLTLTGDLLGTLRYMSPEQALGQRVGVDARTDVYSVGVTLYELLTLEPAYNGRNREEVLRQIAFEEPSPLRRLNKAVPPELETIVLKAMAKIPAERYASAQELADDLRRFLEDKPIRARRPTRLQRARKWARRHQPVAWSAGVSAVLLLLLAVLGLAVSNVQISREKEQKEEALERERQTAYYHQIALAEREWSANNMSRADQLLEDCPPLLRGWEWNYVKGLRRGSLPPFSGHAGQVFSMAFSPDGKYVASASDDCTVKIWNAATGQVLHTLPGSNDVIGPFISVVFSPDSRFLASAATPPTRVKLWETATGQEIRTFAEANHSVKCLVFSPDGKCLAGAIPTDHAVWTWDVETGEKMLHLEGHTDNVFCVTFSPDGRLLASGSKDQTVRVWDAASGREVFAPLEHAFGVNWVTFSADGKQLATASAPSWWLRGDDGEVKIWDVTTRRVLRTLHGHTGYIFCVAFSPDGRRLATAGYDQTVKIWDTGSGEEALTLRGHKETVYGVAFSSDGHRLVSCSGDGTLRIWDATPLEDRPDQAIRTLRHHTGRVTSVAFSPDSRRIASTSQDLTVRIADPFTRQEIMTLGGHTDHINKVVFSPDGRLASAGMDWKVKVWDATTGQELLNFDGQAGVIHSLVYSHDGKRLATAHWRKVAKIWDAATGNLIRALEDHTHVVFAVSFSPDDRYLATGSVDATVKIWDPATGQVVQTLRGHTGKVHSVAFSPDGQYLASAAADETVRVWDATNGKCTLTLPGHVGWVWCVAYSPDGKFLASAGNDAVIRIWDATNGQERATLHGHTRWVENVAFSPDGKYLASASWDGTVKIWQTPP
jgi:WD40 repeat protein/serine/threonine protein kinase